MMIKTGMESSLKISRFFFLISLISSLGAHSLVFAAKPIAHIGLAKTEAVFSPRSRTAQSDIWQVLRTEMHESHYALQPSVQEKLAWFINNPSFLNNAVTRAAPYLYYIVQQVKARHLPIEYALVPIIESGFNPFSTSPMGAAGIWQLMPNTALGYGIKKTDWGFDGRRDVIASTQAALNYFVYLHQYFGRNFLLALAAYNTGEGNVLKAIKKNLANKLPIDFWSLPIPQETKDYVPSLLALTIIISEPEKYPQLLRPIGNYPYLTKVAVARELDLQTAAGFAGLSLQELQKLNPGYQLPSANMQKDHQLILPITNLKLFKENLAAADFNLKMHWFHYRVKENEKLADIASKFFVPESAIQNLNQLAEPKALAGATILIPQINHANINKRNIKSKLAKIKPPVQMSNIAVQDAYYIQPGDTVYMVRPQDNLEKIAQKFNIDKQAIIAANPSTTIKKLLAGDQLIVPTHIVS